MKKDTIWQTIKSDIIYLLLISTLSFFFIHLVNIQASLTILISIGVLNLLILQTWFIRIFFLNSGRKISQYSEVIQRISLRERFFEYFILPILFLSTFQVFLFFNRSLSMAYWVYILCMFAVFILFLNVKSSLRKIYRISDVTKGVFDLISIITFFLSLNVLLRLDLELLLLLLLTFFFSLTLLIFELHLHNRLEIESVLISIVSSAFVSLTVGAFIFQSIFTASAVGTVSYYLIIALWNVRFSGKYKFSDYLSPFIYSVITLILIFNL